MTAEDPVLARRRLVARLTTAGQRAGYGLFGLAVILFVVGAMAGFTGFLVAAVTGCLVAGSVVLAPAIVLGFAVKAAEREDRQRGPATPEPPNADGPRRDTSG